MAFGHYGLEFSLHCTDVVGEALLLANRTLGIREDFGSGKHAHGIIPPDEKRHTNDCFLLEDTEGKAGTVLLVVAQERYRPHGEDIKGTGHIDGEAPTGDIITARLVALSSGFNELLVTLDVLAVVVLGLTGIEN